MSLISRMRRQSGVLWPLTSTDPHGQPVWGTPVQIRVRWEEETKLQLSPEWEIDQEATVVYVDRDVAKGSYLMLGTTSSPLDPDPRKAGARKVLGFHKNPNLRATEWVRRVALAA